MSTITDSLKNFYKKLGGSLSNLGPNSTSADIVDAMAEVYTDKEGTYVEVTEAVTEGTKIATIKTNNVNHDIYAPVELPAVTSVDEGKVLSVDSNGDWVAADGSDVIIIEAHSSNGVTYIIDGYTTWAAMVASVYASGKVPILRTTHSTNRVIFVPSNVSESMIIFERYEMNDNGKLTVEVIGAYSISSDAVTKSKYERMTVPKVTSSDNGKIVQVINGVWDKTDLPAELPAVTSADGGKVLSVDSNGVWVPAELSNGIPAFTSADAGKVLTVNSSGVLEWVTPT